MAASFGNFRSALHGFNRSDVVQFIQNQTMEHERALRSTRDENTRLQSALESLRKELESCRAENIALKAELDEARIIRKIVEEPVAEAPAPVPESEPAPATLDAPMAPVATVVSAAPSDFNELELAAYRRAEMTERMARERASASAGRMKAIFAQADEKLLLTSQDLVTLMDAFRNDFEQMQQLLATAQGIVNESSDGLKAASELCEDL